MEHGVELIRFLECDNHLVKPFNFEDSLNIELSILTIV